MLLVDDVADTPPLVLPPDPVVGAIVRDVYQLIGECLGLKFAGTPIKGGEPTMIGPAVYALRGNDASENGLPSVTDFSGRPPPIWKH